MTANDVFPSLPKEWSPVPRLRGPIPGPKARDFLARDAAVISPSYTRTYPLVAKRGRGAVLEDVDGNLFLDFAAGIAVCSTGHAHPRVVAAARAQMEDLIHMSGTDFYYPAQVEAAEAVARCVPIPGPKKVFFGNSGAEAIEAAIKLARFMTKRHRLVAFYGAFHGRTMGALSLTNSKATQRRGFGPLLPGVHHVPYATCSRCAYNLKYPGCALRCVEAIEDLLFHGAAPADEVAAIVVESIQGEGGYVVPPPDYYKALRALCDKHGILLVVDEVQSGMGRTGKMCAIEHWGVTPDIVCLAKGIASGFPLGAIVTRADLMAWPPGAHASTFGGNPVSCAAAVETIRLLEEGLVENAARTGAYLKSRLENVARDSRICAEVRGKGLMVGVELVKDRESLAPAPEHASAVIEAAFRRGLLLLPCGPNTIRFSPSLVVREPEVDLAVGIFAEALAEVG